MTVVERNTNMQSDTANDEVEHDAMALPCTREEMTMTWTTAGKRREEVEMEEEDVQYSTVQYSSPVSKQIDPTSDDAYPSSPAPILCPRLLAFPSFCFISTCSAGYI
jgi:hypothetical protein